MDADFLLPALQTNFHAMQAIATFLDTANDRSDVLCAFGDMDTIAQDTEGLLKDAFKSILPPEALGASRLPRRSDVPLSVDEVLQAFQTSLAIMEIEIESLLKKRVDVLGDEEYMKLKRRTDYVITMIGITARYYKKSITAKHPGFWTEILDRQFEKYLKIKPPS
jgi:hypothetical protein